MTTYFLQFRCLNCGREFDECFPKGTEVFELNRIFEFPCCRIGNGFAGDRVKCPTCGSTRTEKDLDWKEKHEKDF